MQSQPEAMASAIGFAGLGAMGMGMATNLVQAGYSVSGFDVFPKALETFAARGGRPSPSLTDMSRGQSKLFVMVASPQQVDQLVPDLITTLPPRAILCLFSTLPAAYVLDLKAQLEAMGRPDIRLLDCPVSGGVVGANSGKLTIMLSGDEEALREIQPELDVISAPGRLFRAGPLGSASTIKMLNQHLAGSHVIAAAETLAFAKALGLSSRDAYTVLTASEGGSWIMGDRGISMLNGDFTPKSAVTIFTKDMGIANAAADESLLPCPIASTAYQVFMERAARGYGRDDDASVVCNYEDIMGAKVAEPLESATAAIPSPSTTPPPSGKHRSVVLVVQDEKLAKHLKNSNDALKGSEGETLQLVRADQGDLATVLRGTSSEVLVGVTGNLCHRDTLQRLASEFPEHCLFDYQTAYSNDFNFLQILFSANDHNNNVAAVLGERLNAGIQTIPVKGLVGSASAMHSAVRYSSLVHVAAAAECYALASAQGVSAELLYELISGAAGSSNQFNQVFPKMMTQDFSLGSADGDISLAKAVEDLQTLKYISQKISFPGRMLDAAHQLFKGVSRKVPTKESSSSALTLFWDRPSKDDRAVL